MMPNFDPDFARACIWLSFTSLCVITICLPLIVFFLMRLCSEANEQRGSFRREQNQIADELEKLRKELSAKCGSAKAQ